ncbi:Ubiquitin fusion degradation protein 1 [Galdieria sulphuraria]|uniref:Ubiquitin fusion degradation protein n=1 Tax=Galdieria sulphuraria TaxID=130081 RepID=M2VY02_GALSU|nr:ubiquitin fusion degradation protein [Galdieria sulphuraria]EME28181.1 ubiquitin fusion degradation protein [Galdieria sulphuraria]GJD07307.1 Ubiquitin fusion degradation protein 1 [Galdieria sulphuraria]|eukprot:XP_005704701.1 ubiquitin fusion degradation protein [Galdieria sulphuraria]
MFPLGGGGVLPGFPFQSPFPIPSGSFQRNLRAYPVSFIDKPQLENGDKIVLPPSALDALTQMQVSYPMLFQLESSAGRVTHCGVMEFIAEEGFAYLPYWMMQNMAVGEGELIKIRNANLPKGTFVKLRPQSSEFLAISDPKAVLEARLRNFSCLTQGDTIAIHYLNRIYWIDILQVQPGDAISIIDADVNVEFAPPADMETKQYNENNNSSNSSLPSTNSFGTNMKKDDTQTNFISDSKAKLEERRNAAIQSFRNARQGHRALHDSDSESSEEEDSPTTKKAFVPFGGEGRSLRGTVSSKVEKETQSKENSTNDKTNPSAASFVPFSGKGRTLRD